MQMNSHKNYYQNELPFLSENNSIDWHNSKNIIIKIEKLNNDLNFLNNSITFIRDADETIRKFNQVCKVED
jgi:hypothetical protein